MRCRISTQAGLGVTGFAPDGEVEDHLAPIGVEQPAIGAAKQLISIVRDGSDLIFLVTSTSASRTTATSRSRT